MKRIMLNTLINIGVQRKFAKQTCRQPLGWQVVSVFNAKGPPVPIPNTEVKLCSAENTWLETARENRSTLTQDDCKSKFVKTDVCESKLGVRRKPNKRSKPMFAKQTRRQASAWQEVGYFNAKGPPVPIPNTEVKLCSAENTWLATARKNRS